MGEILVFSEKADLTFELLSKGQELKAELGLPLAAALLGAEAAGRADDCFAYGADRVYVSDDPLLADFTDDVYAQALTQTVEAGGATVVLMGSTRRGKALAPRLAQRLGAGCITDAIGLRVDSGQLLVDRYAFGGNTVSTEKIATERQVIATMPKSFETADKGAGTGQATKLDLRLTPSAVKIVERRPKAGETVNIEEAETLVCIGRGLEKEEDLAIIRELTAALGAEMGCTRSLASDYEWLSEERMVGLSGKKANPRLYVSVGISGQIQHTVGILGSRVIVAINKDKEAPIFQIADYGIVGDLYEVVPKLTAKIKG